MDVKEEVRVKKKISLKETFNKFMPEWNEENVFTGQVVIAVLIGILTLVFILRLFRGGSKKRGVLLVGLCESGKTLLFSRLCHDKEVVSVTSMKESSGEYTFGKKSLTMYDLPGHERIRMAAFEKVKKLARGIIFMVDSATLQKDVRDVAEYLYTILCDNAIQSSKTRVLIACNKQDLSLARSAQLIQKTLEKEMNLLRVTQANQLQSVGEGGNNNRYLGHIGKDFEFSHLSPMKVEFVEVTTKSGEKLNPVTAWLQQLA
ncbi:signal recognition particle receptor subunit beta-like [Macrobrachium nipponense]|uniref:signal recognition particle receptor subunit beta-like n=1 Tax=Macrobrachium nipponense TaxID=159736 RepID=UPI0030C81FDE